MRVIKTEIISDHAPARDVPALDRDLKVVQRAVGAVVWPPGSKTFAIKPIVGANGTPQIKKGFIANLVGQGWKAEFPLFKGLYKRGGPGPVDVATTHDGPRTVVEWETGNVSSSHRALNKVELAFKKGLAKQGIWVVPSKKLYRYLTGRTGSYEEVQPYFEIFKRKDLPGRLVVIVIEHDKEDGAVDVITKMAYKGNLPVAKPEKLPASVQTQLDALALEEAEPS